MFQELNCYANVWFNWNALIYGTDKPSTGYQLIVADPPWFSKSVARTTKPETKYETFNEFKLLEIPIPKLADPQGAVVLVWIVSAVDN
jgi:N6-adenosine-specific RNA methylase IME4